MYERFGVPIVAVAKQLITFGNRGTVQPLLFFLFLYQRCIDLIDLSPGYFSSGLISSACW
jgi:hypothetical protein